ncbi:hypothetical protein XH80_25240 [Bradyrhizobium sp. CCBAU 45384]|nr:hypothetical protein [Bradyrhizobium sp. CCBAU 45384]
MLAIGWKAAMPFENPNYLKKAIVSFLERQDFDVVVTEQVAADTPIIRATRASCQLQVAQLTPDGSNRNLVRHLTIGMDRSFVVFRGGVYTQQPIGRTVLHYLLSRFLRELGLIRQISYAINVAENSSCNAEELPWTEFEDRT